MGGIICPYTSYGISELATPIILTLHCRLVPARCAQGLRLDLACSAHNDIYRGHNIVEIEP